MVGIAVPTMVDSTAAMNCAIMQAARTQRRSLPDIKRYSPPEEASGANTIPPLPALNLAVRGGCYQCGESMEEVRRWAAGRNDGAVSHRHGERSEVIRVSATGTPR